MKPKQLNCRPAKRIGLRAPNSEKGLGILDGPLPAVVGYEVGASTLQGVEDQPVRMRA